MLVLSSSLIHCIPALLTFLLFFFFTLGSKALDYSNGLFDCQSPSSPFMGNLRALHLLEDLRGILELLDNDGRNSLRCQIPDSTAESLVEWLQGRLVSASKPGIVTSCRLLSHSVCLSLSLFCNSGGEKQPSIGHAEPGRTSR